MPLTTEPRCFDALITRHGRLLRTVVRQTSSIMRFAEAPRRRSRLHGYRVGRRDRRERAGRLEEAVARLQLTVAMEPGFVMTPSRLGLALEAIERYPEAIIGLKG